MFFHSLCSGPVVIALVGLFGTCIGVRHVDVRPRDPDHAADIKLRPLEFVERRVGAWRYFLEGFVKYFPLVS